jgi:6-phosphofructokinase 2
VATTPVAPSQTIALPSLLTLTLNPALDLATTTERVMPVHKMRCGPVLRFAGGGGINVARVLNRLGCDVQAWALTGGAAGSQIAQLLAAEGLPTHLLDITGDTRENLAVVETTTGEEFRFVLPGPTLLPTEWQGCLEQLGQLHPAPHWIVASGSLPPGVPDDFYAQLARLVHANGWRLALDCSGAPLAAALAAGVGVDVVKPSLRELRELTGAPLQTPADWRAAALAIVHQGQARTVALSLGEQGAVLANHEGVWHAPAIAVPADTGTTGAGDCFLAGLIWAMEQGKPAPEALRWGIAAGTAALLSPGTALAQASDVHRLVQQVELTP